MSCYPTWVSTLCQRSSPFRCFPFGVLRPCRERQHVWLQFAGLLLGLCWRVLCCATWVSPMCRALPQGLQRALLSMLQVPLGFSGHRVSVLLLPWWRGLGFSPSLLFWASPAPLACWGSWGFAPCVRVLLLRWCLLGLQVRSPCCPSLTLGWVCFWPEVSQPFVGCDGGLGCPSWFVTSLGSQTAYSGRELVQVPNVFLAITLGSSLSLPVLAAGLRWLRFILGCPPSVASLWRGLTWFFIRYWLACPHGAAVPLDC